MQVSEIITQVAQLGLNEDYPDAELQERILAYINRGHEQAYTEVAQYLEPINSTTETVAITAGAGTIVGDIYKYISVVDTNAGRVLTPTTAAELEEADPALSQTGQPIKYYKVGNQIFTYPINDTSIRIRYIPQSQELTAITTEAELPYPRNFQQVLIWGGLYWMSLDERDASTNAVLAVAGSNFQNLIGKMNLYLKGNGTATKSVAGVWL